MRSALLAAGLMVTGVLAGCADGADPPQGIVPEDLDIGEYTSLIPADRPVVANVTVHEDPESGSMDVASVAGADTWEPRDVELTYHGLAETYDEWGRLVPAHVFRYEPMRLVVDDIEVGPGGVSASGHYEPTPTEYYFDAADGRYMGRADLDREVRNFASPDTRHPFTWGYEGPYFLFMMTYFLEGDLDQAVQFEGPDRTYNHTLEPYDGERPMAGDCAMRELVVDDGRDEPVDPDEADPLEERRTIVCFDGFLPLWTWSGSEAGGAMRMARDGPPFTVPGPVGEVLAPHEHARAPMDRIDPPLGLPVAPTYVPPSRASVDWAHPFAPRAEAMYRSPGYLEYAARHDELYLQHGITGWPPHSLMFLPLGGGLPVDPPLSAEETTWMMTTEGPGMYWLNVHTARHGEADELHYPDIQGGDFDVGTLEYPSRAELGDLVLADEVQVAVPDIVPEDPRMLKYLVWPAFDGVDMGASQISWWAMGNCFEHDDDARFLAFSGVDGRLYGAGKMESHQNGCSASTYFLQTSAFEAIEVFPPTLDRPAGMRMPDGSMLWSGPVPGATKDAVGAVPTGVPPVS